MGEEQVQIWDTVQEQIDRSTIKRLNWKKLLGRSLTKFIAKGKGLGLTSKELYDYILNRHPYLTEEAKRRLWISICSRYAEMSSEMYEYYRVKKGIEQHRGKK